VSERLQGCRQRAPRVDLIRRRRSAASADRSYTECARSSS
jgi:hypothetical protein